MHCQTHRVCFAQPLFELGARLTLFRQGRRQLRARVLGAFALCLGELFGIFGIAAARFGERFGL